MLESLIACIATQTSEILAQNRTKKPSHRNLPFAQNFNIKIILFENYSWDFTGKFIDKIEWISEWILSSMEITLSNYRCFKQY